MQRKRPLRPTSDPPPRNAPKWHRLLVVPPSAELLVLALADSVLGVMRHYDRRTDRFVYCHGPEEGCLQCKAGRGRLWSGYLPVIGSERDPREQCTLVIPESAYNHSTILRSKQLRGRGLRLWRLVARKNGPVRCIASGKDASPERLPQPWDLEQELMVRYGLADRAGLAEDDGEEVSLG